MKIYIGKLNPVIDISNLINYKTKSTHYCELYSKDGIFRIENGHNLKKINFKDGEIKHIQNYLDELPIYIDATLIIKDKYEVSHIPNDFIERKYYVTYYTLRKDSPLIFVVETEENNDIKDYYFMLYGIYAAYSNADIYNESIKNDIREFLKLVNYKK